MRRVKPGKGPVKHLLRGVPSITAENLTSSSLPLPTSSCSHPQLLVRGTHMAIRSAMALQAVSCCWLPPPGPSMDFLFSPMSGSPLASLSLPWEASWVTRRR